MDPTSPLPAFYQIAGDIRHRIRRGEWKPGDQLPSQPDLAAAYGVSRMTLQHALALLEREGVIIRRRGRGTFVNQSPTPLVPLLESGTSFSRQVKRLGVPLRIRIISVQIKTAPGADITANLGVDMTAEVACLQRVFLAQGQPIALSTSWLPHSLCPGITQLNLSDSSLADTLSDRYGLVAVFVDQWLQVSSAAAEEAALLSVDPGAPLLLVSTLTALADGQPLEYATTKCVAARVRLGVQIGAMDIISS